MTPTMLQHMGVPYEILPDYAEGTGATTIPKHVVGIFVQELSRSLPKPMQGAKDLL